MPKWLRSPWRRTVEEHVDFSTWPHVRQDLPAAAAARLHGDLAAALVALRSVALAGFGKLDRSGRVAGRRCSPRCTPGSTCASRPAGARAIAHEVLAREAALFTTAEEAVVTHDDLHGANVLVRHGPTGWRLAALLDWEESWAGPVDADLARLSLWDGMTGPRCWSVYRAAIPERAVEPRRALVLQLLWCLEHDWPTPRHRADTARLCGLLGVRRS